MSKEQLKKLKDWRTDLSATLVLNGHKMGEELQNEVRYYRNLLSDAIEQIELLKRKVKELRRSLEHGAEVAVETAKRLHQEQEENKRYREVLSGVLKILDSEDWSKYDASALQDNIDDYITLKNGDLLEGSE